MLMRADARAYGAITDEARKFRFGFKRRRRGMLGSRLLYARNLRVNGHAPESALSGVLEVGSGATTLSFEMDAAPLTSRRDRRSPMSS